MREGPIGQAGVLGVLELTARTPEAAPDSMVPGAHGAEREQQPLCH